MTDEFLPLLLSSFEDENSVATENSFGRFGIEPFEAMRVLTPLPPVNAIWCPKCGINLLSVRRHRDGEGKKSLFVQCGHCGRQLISPKLLRIWRVHHEPFIQKLKKKLALGGYPQELVPNHTWSLGKRDGREMILVRNAHITRTREFQEMMARHTSATVLVFKHFTRNAVTRLIDNEVVSLDEITQIKEDGEIEFDLSVFGETAYNAPPEFQFVKKGAWFIRFYGNETILTDDLEGIQYIYHLVKFPNRTTEIREFAADVTGQNTIRGITEGGDATMDEQAKAEYARRLRELAAERQRAEEENDHSQLERINREFYEIESLFNRDRDHRGKSRTMGDASEGLKRNIVKKIRRAVNRMQENDPSLATHFKNSIKCGKYIIYRPPEEIPWVFA